MKALTQSKKWVTRMTKKEQEEQTDNKGDEKNNYISIYRDLFATENERPALYGILSVKIETYTPAPGYFIQKDFYLEILYRNFSARTCSTKLEAGTLYIGQQKHFPLKIPRSRAHPFNILRLRAVGGNVEIGSITFHLHDIIRGSPIAGPFNMITEHLEVGILELELTFNYGIFGYGNSLQLQLGNSETLVQYSMLPRINPPPEKCKAGETVLAIQAVPHPKFIPFAERVFLSHGQEFQDELNHLGNSLYLPTTFVKDYDKMLKVREKYFDIKDRASRLKFIHNFLQKSHKRTEIVPEEGFDQNVEFHFPTKEYVRFMHPNVDGKKNHDDEESLDILRSKFYVDEQEEGPKTNAWRNFFALFF